MTDYLFQIGDMMEYENSNTPEIRAGGIGEKYVEIRVTSEIGQRLNYLIMVYSHNSTNIQ